MAGVTGVPIFSSNGDMLALELGLRLGLRGLWSVDGRMVCRQWANIIFWLSLA